MTWLLDLIAMGGWHSYLIILAGLLGFGGGLGSLVAARSLGSRQAALAAALIALGLAVLPLGVGVVGWQLGLRTVEQVLPMVDPESRPAIRARGEEEAFSCVILGGLCTALPLLMALAGLGLAATATDRRGSAAV